MGTRDDLVAALGVIDAEIVEAEDRLESLRLERRGAEALLRRLQLPSDAESSTSSPPRPVISSSVTGNAAIVADVLAGSPEGLHLAEIEARTAEQGKPLGNDQVRGAVAYLKRINRAERRTRGVWRLVPTDTETASEAPEAVSVLPDLRPVGGDAHETGLDDHRDDPARRNGDHPTGTSIAE